MLHSGMLKLYNIYQEPSTPRHDAPAQEGQYAQPIVPGIAQDKPRFIFIGGALSLSSGEVNSNQAMKLASYIKAAGVKLADIHMYLPVREQKTLPKELMHNRQHYNTHPIDFTCADGKALSSLLFPDDTLPDLSPLTPEARAHAVEKLAKLASITTLMSFSHGSVVVQATLNNLLHRLHEKHFSCEETQTVISCLMAINIAPVARIDNKRSNLPQLNVVAMNDALTVQQSNYTEQLDSEQHPIILNSMPHPNVMLLGTHAIGQKSSVLKLIPNKRDGLFASELHYRDGKTIPYASHEMRFAEKEHSHPHIFDLYTATSRILNEPDSERPGESFVVHTYSQNPVSALVMETIGKAVNASIDAHRHHRLRDSGQILSDLNTSLTPEAKDELVLHHLRAQLDHQMTRRFAKGYTRFAENELSNDEFKHWSHEDNQSRDRTLDRFDQKADAVRHHALPLTEMIRWSSQFLQAAQGHPCRG